VYDVSPKSFVSPAHGLVVLLWVCVVLWFAALFCVVLAIPAMMLGLFGSRQSSLQFSFRLSDRPSKAKIQTSSFAPN
jgi:hypothetical protein